MKSSVRMTAAMAATGIALVLVVSNRHLEGQQPGPLQSPLLTARLAEPAQSLEVTAVDAPTLCPGSTPLFVFTDNLEAGSGNWTTDSTSPTLWELIANQAPSGVYSLYGANPPYVSDHRVVTREQWTVPVTGGRFYFDHSFEFDLGSANVDGGVVEYSINNGASWIDAGNLIEAGQAYNGTLDTGNPLGNRPAFVRSSLGWTGTRLNLQSISGETARFRARVGSDGTAGSFGWLLDNISLYSCTGAASTTITMSPATLNVGATKNGPDGSLASVTPPQAVTIGYTGLVPSWTATSNQPWAVVTGGSGTGAGQFTVSIANPGNVIGGSTSLVATITISAPTANPETVTVNLAVQQVIGASAAPFGQVDTPVEGTGGLVGAIGVTGWALDDVGVSTVSVYRPCLAFDNPASCQIVQGNNLVFVGTGAFLAGARPDVEAAFPTLPRNYRGGWGFQILTNMLPHIPNGVLFGGQGVFSLYAYATDVEGNQTLLGRTSTDHTPTTIAVANDTIAKPFGTIDTPLLGETVSGVIANFGWVLTPDSNTVSDGTDIVMPLNGSTMTVYIDGNATAQVAYNQCRGTVGNPPPGGVFCNDDIANIFGRVIPAATLTPRPDNPTRYRNLDAARGAIGAYNINTLALTNGMHTIAWGVSDSAGRGEGIGGRFFTVLNGGPPSPRPSAGATAWPAQPSSGATARQAPLSPEASARPGSAVALADLLDAPAQSRGSASTLGGLRRSRRLVSAREGFNPATPMQEMTRRADAVRTIAIPSTGRAEIAFAAPVNGGYLVANGQLRDLPVGSRLDPRTGVFTWNPPPQYVGPYRLVFLIGGERVDVEVTVK